MDCGRRKSRRSTLCRHTGRYRQQQDSHESDRQTQVHDLRRRSLIIRRCTTRDGCRYFTTIRRNRRLLVCPSGTYQRSAVSMAQARGSHRRASGGPPGKSGLAFPCTPDVL